jgi:TPR repeat
VWIREIQWRAGRRVLRWITNSSHRSSEHDRRARSDNATASSVAEAIASWEQASSLRPDDPDIHYQLGFWAAAECTAWSIQKPRSMSFSALSLALAQRRSPLPCSDGRVLFSGHRGSTRLFLCFAKRNGPHACDLGEHFNGWNDQMHSGDGRQESGTRLVTSVTWNTA